MLLAKQGHTRERLGSYTLCSRFTKCHQASISAETHAKLAAHDILENAANMLGEREQLKVLGCLK